MALSGWTLAAVSLDGATIEEIADQSADFGIELFANRAGGSQDVSYIAGKSQTPRLRFTTHAIKQILDLTAFDALAISTTVDLFFYKLKHGGSRDTSGHVKLTLNDGCIIPRRISAAHNAEATIEVEVIGTYDGTNAPIIYGAGATLPSSALEADEKFTLGGVKMSSTIYEAQNLDIDFGLQEWVQGYNGEQYARYAGVMSREIKATVKSNDLATLNIATAVGAQQDNVILFLRKISQGASRVAAATEEHISITIPKCYVYPGSASASVNSMAEAEVVFCARDQGSNAPVTLDTTAAIA